jgi:general stress protein YciG
MSGNSNRGFANMNPDQQREIARKGGLAVSSNREHMAAIGRKGGQASGVSRSQKANNSQNNEETI